MADKFGSQKHTETRALSFNGRKGAHVLETGPLHVEKGSGREGKGYQKDEYVPAGALRQLKAHINLGPPIRIVICYTRFERRTTERAFLCTNQIACRTPDRASVVLIRLIFTERAVSKRAS